MSDPSLQQARDADFDERRSAMLQWKKDCEDRVLSLRDQFAAAALTGLLCGTRDVQPFHESAYAELAYRCADAMLAARSATYFKKMADEMDAAGVLPVAPPPSA